MTKKASKNTATKQILTHSQQGTYSFLLMKTVPQLKLILIKKIVCTASASNSTPRGSIRLLSLFRSTSVSLFGGSSEAVISKGKKGRSSEDRGKGGNRCKCPHQASTHQETEERLTRRLSHPRPASCYACCREVDRAQTICIINTSCL